MTAQDQSFVNGYNSSSMFYSDIHQESNRSSQYTNQISLEQTQRIQNQLTTKHHTLQSILLIDLSAIFLDDPNYSFQCYIFDDFSSFSGIKLNLK